MDYKLLFCIVVNIIWSKSVQSEVTYTVTSSETVTNTQGENKGPVVSLSKTILESNENLHYICRQYDFGGRSFEMKKGGEWQPVPGDSPSSTVCDEAWRCTVDKGVIPWSRERGGQYRCGYKPNLIYTIYWINPKALVPGNILLENDKYGSQVKLFCAVDMTPTDVGYSGILSVSWEWQSLKTQQSFIPVTLGRGIELIVPQTGSNYTLQIDRYNAVNHGGTYRCKATVTGRPTITSSSFSLESKARAVLRNNKRSNFHFGVNEDVEFFCEVESYPFAKKVELQIDFKNVYDLVSDPTTDYSVDTTSIEGNKHIARALIRNISSVVSNNSQILCKVYRDDLNRPDDDKREQIWLFDEAPPVETTDNGLGRNGVSRREEPTKPWVIAIAVIIPIVIILIIVVFLVWRYRGRFGDEGDYSVGNTDDPDESQYKN